MSKDDSKVVGVAHAGLQKYQEGPGVPGPMKPFKARPNITIDMSKPGSQKADCVFVGRHTHVEFLVRAGDDTTTYDIHYGRWVGARDPIAPRNLNHWKELGVKTETLLAASGDIGRVQFETNGDAVAIWIDGITPTPATGEGFMIWYGGVSGRVTNDG